MCGRDTDTRTYPVSPEDLDLIVRDDDPVVPVHGGDDEDQDVAGDPEIGTNGHNHQT